MMDTSGPGSTSEQAKRQGLITANDLNYVLEPDMSVAVNKTTKKHFFQSTAYDHTQNAICIFNSGADYIDTRRSFLSFQAEITAPNNVVGYFGTHGSACNLIDNITISTRSGDEIARVTDFNLLQNMMTPITYDKEWCKTVGGPMGYGGCVMSVDDAARYNGYGSNIVAGGQFSFGSVPAMRFNIPMYILTPFFGYGRLMPAMIMSGLRIEIGWAQPEVAFMGGHDNTTDPTQFVNVAPVTSYAIKNAYFSLCSVQLSDSVQRALNEQSATNGLEIVYTDYEKTESSYQGAATNCNIEVRKSCSRALKAFVRVRAEGPMARGDKDSLKSEQGFPYIEYQWQLGSLYFPQQPCKADDPNSTYGCASEAYSHLLESVDKYTPDSRQPMLEYNGSSGVDGDRLYRCILDMKQEANVNGSSVIGQVANSEFIRGLQVIQDGTFDTTGVPTQSAFLRKYSARFGKIGSFCYDQHVIGVNLERSSLFNLAGVPVNNSRVLAFRANLSPITQEPNGGGDGAGNAPVIDRRIFSVYLSYVRLCRCFLNNVEVEQ